HVNADDPEACMAAVKLAYEYRNKFNKDFVIDLIGYRRYGHNEMDEPSATQPQLYEIIRKHSTVKEIYAEKLMKENVITEEEIKALKEEAEKKLSEQYQKVSKFKIDEPEEIEIPEEVEKPLPQIDTGYPLDDLKQINKELI